MMDATDEITVQNPKTSPDYPLMFRIRLAELLHRSEISQHN